MVYRIVTPLLEQMVSSSRISILAGPAQSGKTSLVRSIFPDKPYISLDNPGNSKVFYEDIRAWFAAYPDGAIIDDLSWLWNWPWFFSLIEPLEPNISGNFLFVSTSNDPDDLNVMGKVPYIQMHHLSLPEICLCGKEPACLFSFVFNGGMPALIHEGQDRNSIYSNYTRLIASPFGMDRYRKHTDERYMNFLILCANRIGCTVNSSEIGRNCAVSACTATRWIKDLEKKGVVFLLPATEQSFGKRSRKASILYFFDTGFACYLAGITDSRKLLFDRMRDQLFGNQIILDLMKRAGNMGDKTPFFHWREHRGSCIPLLYKTARGIASFFFHTGIEPDVPHIKCIRRLLRRLGLDYSLCILIYAGSKEKIVYGIHILPWQRIHEIHIEW